MASIKWVALPDGVKWGTNVVYAKAMHYGLLYLNVTPRPYMGMNENDRASVLNIINRIMDVDL